jgi:DnaK suppressor protein
VRPIGMLPPSAVARTSVRPTHKGSVAARVATPAPTRHESTSREGAQRVSEKDYKEFEERLLQERRRILKEMGHLETTVLKVNQRDSSGDLSGYSFHMADAGTDAMEREKAFLFASAEGRVLLEIDDALRRIYRGAYGTCEMCGNPIARARLEVMPAARLCIACKEKEEKEQRGAG